MKPLINYIIALAFLLNPFSGGAQSKEVLWQYTMSDGSTIHAMSDNGKWAVAYGISEATSAYSFPKLLNFSTHTVTEILTETESQSGIECYVNDVTNDGEIVVGCYDGKPAYWKASEKKWIILPLANDNLGGRVEAITPDGHYAVGACTNGGYDEVPAMWDIAQKSIITLEGLPPCDLSGGYQAMTRLTDLSADGRYIVGCVSYSYPADVLYFLYDRTLKKWDAVAFDYNAITRVFTPRDNQVRTLDGITISPNGKWVAGVVYSTTDVRNPFRYNTETKQFENFNRPEDLDKGCVSVDNQGTIYAATPAINPSRSLYILHNNNWYGIDEVLKQQYGIDFYTYTGFAATGLCIDIADDCKTMAAIAYISDENYQITLPTTFAEACDNVNLLATYTPSIRSGATIQKISNLSIEFTRDIETTTAASSITLVDENGTAVRSALKFEVDNNSSKVVNIGFRTTTLDASKKYSIIIPEGAITIKGDANHKNEQITLYFYGLGNTTIQAVQVTPAAESTLGHIDISTNPVIFTYNVDVLVKEGAKAFIYRNDESEPISTLEMQHGMTSESRKMVLVYPTTTLYLYKDNTYRIVVPAESLTDASGYATNSTAEVTYIGSYERTIVSDDTHIYMESFENGMNNVMLFDGDNNTPTADMQAWSFTNSTAWTYAADDDYTNTCAVSHSMYLSPGSSDDWMVTPQLYIPDKKCTLTFAAQSYYKNRSDILKVIIYSCNEKFNELNSTIINQLNTEGEVVVEETLSPGLSENSLEGDWQQFEVDLAKYANKNIYIAFANQNTDQSAIFVTNISVTHNVDFQIQLNGVPEMVVAQSSQLIKGAIIIKDSDKTYTSAKICLFNTLGAKVEEINATNLSLSKDNSYNFQFSTPLPLTIGKDCNFSVDVTLDNGATSYKFNSSIKNLAFAPTKRVILEENTGMGCQNCPLGHLALEYLEHTYGELFIPIAYHTYTGDPLESGMTDYAQYFLNLTAAPTAAIQRGAIVSSPMLSYTENGVTDYTFYSKSGDAWLDLVAAEFAKPTDADLSIGAEYISETNTIQVHYAFTSAIDCEASNIGLLCIITEDGLVGYQSNGFYSVTDPDLGAWQKGGAYGKSAVYPYTFNDVARALYPSTSYYGQTGFLPSTLTHNEKYTGILRINVDENASYVKELQNCKITLLAIDANDGSIINAARVKIGDFMTDISESVSLPDPIVTPTHDGIAINLSGNGIVTLYNVNGIQLNSAKIKNSGVIKTSHRGIMIVKVQQDNVVSTYKILR